jgi:tetratricopeptide (TPR) repeat protein
VADPVTAAWVAGHLRRLVGVGAGRPVTGGDLITAADREEEFAAWRRFLHGLAATRPLVLALEDLHRADDALLDFVEGLGDRGRRPGGHAGAGHRPPRAAGAPARLGRRRHHHPLDPLGDPDTTGLLATLLAHHGLATEVGPTLLGRVGGNPLFAEEYVRMLRDRGPDADALPAGVHAIVAARLDALAAADKAVLQDAAVLGQVGWLGALAEITGRGREDLEGCLDRLEGREFLQRAPASRVAGEVEYAFRHLLVRDVAYGQVLRAERADKHRRAAAWIEALAPDRAEGRAELLASHYRAALSFARAAGTEPPGLAARALAALREAGDRAAALGGWETAARFHAEALELSPEGDPGRGQLLLRLGRDRCRAEMAGEEELTAAREALLAAGGPVAAAEAEMLLGELAFLQGRGGDREAHHARALELVAGAPPSATSAAVLRGAMMHLMVASRHAEGLAVAREVLSMARTLGLPDLEVDALGAIGTARVEGGDPGGLEDLEAAIAMVGEAGTPSAILWHMNLAWTAAALGDLRRCFTALAAAERLAERFGSRRWRRAIELQRVAERYWTGRWDEAVAVVDAMVATGEALLPGLGVPALARPDPPGRRPAGGRAGGRPGRPRPGRGGRRPPGPPPDQGLPGQGAPGRRPPGRGRRAGQAAACRARRWGARTRPGCRPGHGPGRAGHRGRRPGPPRHPGVALAGRGQGPGRRRPAGRGRPLRRHRLPARRGRRPPCRRPPPRPPGPPGRGQGPGGHRPGLPGHHGPAPDHLNPQPFLAATGLLPSA